MNRFKFPVCPHSKSKINHSAHTLVQTKSSAEEKLHAHELLACFRSSHTYPMQAMLTHFRNKARAIDKKSIIVSRLKRIPSVLSKLKRFPTMKATTMQDIGGIRIIAENITATYRIRDAIFESRTRNKLIKETDYIQTPKQSGYRSIHLIYRYQGNKSDYQNYMIELQIRSKIQHAWATTVEVVGTFNNTALKSEQGDSRWLDFFNLVSQAFACLEHKKPIDPKLVDEIKRQYTELNVHNSLVTWISTAKLITEVRSTFHPFYSVKNDDLFLIRLDNKTQSWNVFPYKKGDPSAYDDYALFESKNLDKPYYNTVLVSSESIKSLKTGYPNYFGDTLEFSKLLKKIIH